LAIQRTAAVDLTGAPRLGDEFAERDPSHPKTTEGLGGQMTADVTGRVSVTRRIGAPAETIFAVLADPESHVVIDGSGMVRKALTSSTITDLGDEFVMAMQHPDMGSYEMANEVVEFEANRSIHWEPRRHQASSPDNPDEIDDPANYVWGYQLAPVDPTTTDVTETFDCSRSPEWLRTATQDGQGWLEAMTISLEKLDNLVAS
jgi:uncharacterized protein YndB with AHSA1/START domain